MNCVFCKKITEDDLECYDHKDSNIFCFEPLNPVVPGHRLFIAALHTRDAADNPYLTGQVFRYASQYGQEQLLPFNLITSSGKAATQSVPHFHVHYVPRNDNDNITLPWTNQVKTKEQL